MHHMPMYNMPDVIIIIVDGIAKLLGLWPL
jgi:hypothetical protein